MGGLEFRKVKPVVEKALRARLKPEYQSIKHNGFLIGLQYKQSPFDRLAPLVLKKSVINIAEGISLADAGVSVLDIDSKDFKERLNQKIDENIRDNRILSKMCEPKND